MNVRISIFFVFAGMTFLSYGQRDRFALLNKVDSVQVSEYKTNLDTNMYLYTDAVFIEKYFIENVNKNRSIFLLKARTIYVIKFYMNDDSVISLTGNGKFFKVNTKVGWYKMRKDIMKILNKNRS